MSYWDILTWTASLLQISVACYALRLNRLFGTSRVGWSLFLAFFLLAIFHLLQSTGPLSAETEYGIRVDIIYALISLLLLAGMVHIETLLSLRLKMEAEERNLRAQLESRVREKTADLIKANKDLQVEIAERKRLADQMEITYRELVSASHHAGMTEVATNVIHNVGNVLNSVNISASVVADHLESSKAPNLLRVTEMLRQHETDLGDFLTNDSKGKQLPGYLTQLAGHLNDERNLLLKEIGFVKKKIEHIKDIVAMQQNYAKIAGVAETVMVTDLLEDALQMNSDALARHDVDIVRDYTEQVPEITVEKHKVLQILVNLIRNAKYACDESGRKDKRMTLRVGGQDGFVQIAVMDNGVGIPEENLTKIFNHGFTTRRGGHGFGLHGGAITAKELGGSLSVHSDGPGQGATFTLKLPRQQDSVRTLPVDPVI